MPLFFSIRYLIPVVQSDEGSDPVSDTVNSTFIIDHGDGICRTLFCTSSTASAEVLIYLESSIGDLYRLGEAYLAA